MLETKMKSSEKHIHLFGPSGCVSENAFFVYLNHELNSYGNACH